MPLREPGDDRSLVRIGGGERHVAAFAFERLARRIVAAAQADALVLAGEHVDIARTHRPSRVGRGDDEGGHTPDAWFELHDRSPYDGRRPRCCTGTIAP